jgi:large subunit ribosomal protein L22
MTKASAKYVRMSPRKLRRVIDEVRGKGANEAQVILKFMPYAAARVIEKVLKSAVSNAKENDKLNPDTLKVTKAFVDQANTLKRWRPVSRGRGYSILKRISHVTIEVEDGFKPTRPGEKLKAAPKSKKHTHDHKHDHDHDHDHDHEHDHDHDHDHDHSHKKAKVEKSEKKETKAKKTEVKSKKKKEDKE